MACYVLQEAGEARSAQVLQLRQEAEERLQQLEDKHEAKLEVGQACRVVLPPQPQPIG